jgi:integrase
VPPSDRTVADLVKEWLDRGKASNRWAGSTYVNYRDRADRWVLPQLGAIKAAQLTTPRVQHWVDGLTAAGLAPSTVQFTARVLSSALAEAVAIGILPRNPCTGVRKPKHVQVEPETWTPDEIRRVIAEVKDDPFWHAVYRTMLATGMRPGELRALKWADIDFAAGIVTVRRTMTEDNDGRAIVGGITKGKRSRQVAVTPEELAVLKTWQTAQKVRRLKTERWHDEDLVFDRGDGRFLPEQTWIGKQARLCERIGVTPIGPHGMRHTHATDELRNGTHPLVVSKRLGHRSIAITLDRYSHVGMDLNRAAAEALDKRLFGDGEATGTD